jgi:hypothetical protein
MNEAHVPQRETVPSEAIRCTAEPEGVTRARYRQRVSSFVRDYMLSRYGGVTFTTNPAQAEEEQLLAFGEVTGGSDLLLNSNLKVSPALCDILDINSNEAERIDCVLQETGDYLSKEQLLRVQVVESTPGHAVFRVPRSDGVAAATAGALETRLSEVLGEGRTDVFLDLASGRLDLLLAHLGGEERTITFDTIADDITGHTVCRIVDGTGAGENSQGTVTITKAIPASYASLSHRLPSDFREFCQQRDETLGYDASESGVWDGPVTAADP